MTKTAKETTSQDMVEETLKVQEQKEGNPITVENFVQKLNAWGIQYNLKSDSIEDQDRLNMLDTLNADICAEFHFKEMKITNAFQYLFACSLDTKIKANCTYKAIMYYKPDQWNSNISQQYWNVKKEITETIQEIKKGGLFNSEEWYQSKITTILTEYENALLNIKAIREDYFDIVEKNQNYEFQCNVAKLENGYESVKRVDFVLGIEAFLRIANYGAKLDLYNLALIEN